MNYEYLHSFVFFFILILSSCFLKFQMGLATSFLMGNGSPTTQMLNLITGSLYTSFVEKETDTFPQFHQAFLDIFNTFNSALPGKHYDVPARPEVKECFDKWKESTDEAKKKKIFVDFIKEKVKLNEPHKSTLITGIVTPPAAMVAKKAGERVPALKLIKVVPDVLFVPSATFLALISVKVSRKVFHNRMLKKDQEREQQTTSII